jgi:hypothetical protein
MSENAETPPSDTPATREELVAMVARAHRDAPYTEAQLAGKALAAQSRLPTLVAVNLGAGFGQWDFFPEAEEIVAFALGYAAPGDEEALWAIARAWASDDAAGRHTILALVGKDILQHELKRIDVPQLRELIGARPAQANVLRATLGLAVVSVPAARAGKPRAPRASPAASPSSAASPSPVALDPPAASDPPVALDPGAAAPAAPVVPPRQVLPPGEMARMPKPAFVRPKVAPPPVVRRFEHPKFGEGVLVTQDGEGPDAKLTIKFGAVTKTLLARYVNELAPA